MDEETIGKLAKEVVALFVADWEGTSTAQVVQRDGAHFLIVRPASPLPELTDAISYATLHLDLEKICKRLLKTAYLEGMDVPEKIITRLHANELIGRTEVAPSLLFYFLNMLEIVTLRDFLEALLGSLSQESKARLANIAERVTQLMLQQHDLLKKTKPGASSVISDYDALEVMRKSRNRPPSHRKLAREMKTTPVNVRNWLRRKGFRSSEELLDDLFRRMQTQMGNGNTRESEPLLFSINKVTE